MKQRKKWVDNISNTTVISAEKKLIDVGKLDKNEEMTNWDRKCWSRDNFTWSDKA